VRLGAARLLPSPQSCELVHTPPASSTARRLPQMETELGQPPAGEGHAGDGCVNGNVEPSASAGGGEEFRAEKEPPKAPVGEGEHAGGEEAQGAAAGADDANAQHEEGGDRIGEESKSGEKPPLPKRSGGNPPAGISKQPAPAAARADFNVATRSSRHNYNPSNPLYRNHDGRPTAGCL